MLGIFDGNEPYRRMFRVNEWQNAPWLVVCLFNCNKLTDVDIFSAQKSAQPLVMIRHPAVFHLDRIIHYYTFIASCSADQDGYCVL